MTTEAIIAKLKELRGCIPAHKEKGVNFRDSEEFEVWQESTKKWLALAGPQAAKEYEHFRYLSYDVSRIRMGSGYDHHDQEAYARDLQTANVQLGSAIENLEMGLSIPADEPSRPGSKVGRTQNFHIKADSVIVGDHGQVTINQEVTVAHIFKALESEVEKRVIDPAEKRGLLAKLKEITSNPMMAGIVAQAASALFKTLAGQ